MGLSKGLQAQLEGPFTKIARAFARNHKIKVVLGGTKCDTSADGTIRLPGNADYLKDKDADLLHGLLDHEWSHQAEESEARANPSYPSPLAIMGALKGKRLKLMFNALEDIRIELKQGAKYIGVGQNLEAAHKHTVEAICKPRILGYPDPKTGRPQQADSWYKLAVTIISTARGWDTSWLPAEWKDMAAFLADEIEASKHTRNAREVQLLAERIIEKLKDISEEPEESGDMEGEPEEGEGEGEEGEGEEGEGGEGSEGDEDGKGEGEDGEGSDDKKEGKDGKSSDKRVTVERAKFGKGGKGAGKGGITVKKAVKATSEKMMREDSKEEDITDELKGDMKMRVEYDIRENGRHMSHPSAIEGDEWKKMPKRDDAEYLKALNSVRPAIGALRSKILTVLQSRRARRYEGDKEAGEIDAASLHSLRTGNRRVFSTRVQDADVNTVVGIVVDQSGSMGNGDNPHNKSYTAKHAVIALSETLNAVGIPFAVWGFSNPGHCYSYDRDGIYNRFESLRLAVYKSFDQSFKAARSSMLGISGGGDNTDGDALMYFARELAHHPAERKILIVLSDGMPLASGNTNLLGKHLAEVVKMIQGAGIEVFGIGIQTNAVEQFYPDFCVVNNMADLAPNTFRMLKKYLLAKKPGQQKRGLPAKE